MNTRRCVHFASQDSLCLNSLAVLCLSHNELKSIDTYYRLAINNGVGHRFVLGCQTPDCYKGWGHAEHRNDSNSFGKRVVGGVYFYLLRADEVPHPVEDGNPRMVEVGVKIKKKRLSVGSEIVDRY